MNRIACILVTLFALVPATLHAATDALDDSAAVTEDSLTTQVQPAQPPAVQPTPQKSVAPKKATASLNLDTAGELFEGGEESLFDDESAAAKKVKVDHGLKTDSTGKPGVGTIPGAVADSTKNPALPAADTSAKAMAHQEIAPQPNSAAKDTIPKAAVARVKVEEVRSINFARNLKDYRSPKLAMLLSLILPGTGQAYAGNYLKTAIFGVIEVGIIGASIAYQVQGKTETIKARHYADQHFSGDKFSSYYDSLRTYFRKNNTDSSLDSQQIDSMAQARMDDIFFPTETNTPFKTTFSNQVASHASDYYNSVQLKSFVQGWDDCTPLLGNIVGSNYAAQPGDSFTLGGQKYFVHSDPDSAYLVSRGISVDSGGAPSYGFSDNQITFVNWMSKANGYYRTGFGILYLLLLNHIGSAIDAGITAKQHNDVLLGKQTFWQRIHFDPICLNTGTQFAPGYEVRVLF